MAGLGDDEFVIVVEQMARKTVVEVAGREVLANLVPPVCIPNTMRATTIGVAKQHEHE